MGKPILFKQKFHKWHDEDLLGHYSISEKNTKALKYLYTSFKHNYSKRKYLHRKNFLMTPQKFKYLYKERFLYQINTKEEEFKRKKRNFKAKNFLNMIKLRVFYGRLKVKPFKSLFKKVLKARNLASGIAPLSLEGRLDILLYRTNLFSSIFVAKHYIRNKRIFVNGSCITEPRGAVRVGDIVNIDPAIYMSLYTQFLEKLRKNKILTNFPKYLEVNYRIGAFMIVRLPCFSEIAYPFPVSSRTILHKFIK